MNKKYLTFLLAFYTIAMAIACRQEPASYDEKVWLAAFNKQEVLDVKPEMVTELDDFCDSPGLLGIDDRFIYIFDRRELVVYILSGKDFQVTAKFGRKGEGPEEFQFIQEFQVYDDFLYVNSQGRTSFFSKNGKLLEEKRCPPHLIPCLPVKNNFVTYEYDMPPASGFKTPYINRKIIWVSRDFEKKKTLFEKMLNMAIVRNDKTGGDEYTLFSESADFRVYKEQIFLGYASMDGFFFTVFNANGNKLYEINRPYQKRKIPEALKQAILKKPYRLHWNNRILKLKFYTYFPPFSNFFVADDRIYIFLYPDVDKQQILILDLKGKLLDVSVIPFDLKIFDTKTYQYFYANKVIYNGESYYLHDNEETNKWELWRLKLTNLPLAGQE